MARRLPHLEHRELALLAAIAILVLSLGWIGARDLRQSAEDASRLYERLSRSLDVVDELQFRTQEVRRIVLYALHTSNANLQLAYAEQSRAADAVVQQLLDRSVTALDDAGSRGALDEVGRAWTGYLVARDEVIGLILEGSLLEGVARDEQQGNARFNEVRQAIARLKASVESEAGVQVAAARGRANRAIARLTLLVISALLAAGVGISLVSRRAALEALLRIEAHKGSILEAVPNPVISTDERGRIVELNEAAERTFGVVRRDALGIFFEDVLLPPARRGVLWPVLSRTQGDRFLWPRIESVGRRHDGSEFPIELAAVTHKAGGARIWTIHVSDLTEQRQSEEELRRAKEAAEVADRAKGEFLATMSHELRTPLVGVVGVADLLQGAELTEPQRDLVSMLRSSANALLGLVSDILDYSRIEAGLMDLAPSDFSIGACIEDAIDPVSELAGRKGLEIGYAILPGVPFRIVADPDRVRQVLLNLLSNAVKFTDAGEVAVRVDAMPVTDRVVTVRMRVTDTGRGIPQEQQSNLFQRFSQIRDGAHPRQTGAGLGLAISERLSRLLGGSLAVESAPGEGSTFTFAFAAGVAAPDAADETTDSLEGIRVLALTGPGIVREQLTELFREWGVHSAIAGDESAAHRALSDDRWDAVIADANALGGSLWQIASDRRLGLPRMDPPTVVVTRLHGAAHVARGADRVVAKPLKARALRDALAALTGIGMLQPRRIPAIGAHATFVPGTLAVLLVEDNDANRRVVELMIEELGLHADVAAGGLDAVEAARVRDYDVILMDVHMPGIDGLEASRRIRAERGESRPTIIALTANVIEGEEARCRAAGMDGYLSKPLRLETLASVLIPLATHRPSVH